MTIAAISAPMPANGQPSSTETMRLVFLTEADNGRGIERPQGAQIDDFGRNARLFQFFGGLQRQLHHAREGHDRHMLAWPGNARLADRHEEFGIVGHREALAVDQLVLEKHDRVRVADRRFEQALVVGAGVGRDHLETRDMRVPARIALRMLRGDPRGDAVRPAKNDRAAHLPARHVAGLRRPN